GRTTPAEWSPGGPASAGATSIASGTTSSGRDASIGVAISRSAATTWIPAETSSPQRARASATRASSIAGLAGRRGRPDEVLDVRGSLLGRVPGREAAVLEDLQLVGRGRLHLLAQHPEQVGAVAGHVDDIGRVADGRGVDRPLEVAGELATGNEAGVATIGGTLALAVVLGRLPERGLVRDLALDRGQPGRLGGVGPAQELDHVPTEGGLHRRQDLARLQVVLGDRVLERLVDRARLVVPGLLAAGRLRGALVGLRSGELVELLRVGLDLQVRRLSVGLRLGPR